MTDVLMTAPALAPAAVALLEAAGCRVHYTPPYPGEALLSERMAALRPAALLSRQGRVTAPVMDAHPGLRVIARHGTGLDEVDLAAARARGIPVFRTPGANAGAVAEHALAVLLALCKDLRPLGETVAAGGWRDQVRVRDVEGMRLGLVGLGLIGRRVARLAQAFGMEVLAWSPTAAPDVAPGVRRLPDLHALLPHCEALSLHCPLLPETRHLLDAAGMARLPEGAFVVNTSRGGLLDEAALLAALERGHLAGAALDVFEEEPPPADHPLRRHPRVLVTPHVAGVTPGSLDRMGVMAAECILAVLQGREPPPGRRADV